MTQVQNALMMNVDVNGAALEEADARALTRVLVHQKLSMPTACELVFVDPQGPLAEGIVRPGAAMRVGLQESADELFSGQMTAVEHTLGPSGTRELRVRGYDLLHQLRKHQPVREHIQVTVADLACEFAGVAGLHVHAHEPGPLFGRILQHRHSDLELLTELLSRAGLFCFVDGDVLELFSLEGFGVPVPLLLGESLLEVSVEVNGEPACRSVMAVGWDALRVETHSAGSSAARLGRRTDAEAPPDAFNASGERSVTGVAVHDDDEALALARSELDARQALEVTCRGVAEGDPRLHPGALIEIAGTPPRLEGRFVLTAAVHRASAAEGYLTEFSTAPPAPPPRRQPMVATVGRVQSVSDPEKLGRIQVSLPAFGDLESDWMGVVAPGAGNGKGLVALPDVDDDVLVLFTDDVTAQGIVLGGLYGTRGLPDGEPGGGAVKRFVFLTPQGQRIALDDGKKTVRLENEEGSFIEAAPNMVRIHAKTDLIIEAGGSVIIRGTNINFKKA